MEAKNNYAFIDSQNLNLAIREQDWILDFKRFRRYLEDKYKVNFLYTILCIIEKYELNIILFMVFGLNYIE